MLPVGLAESLVEALILVLQLFESLLVLVVLLIIFGLDFLPNLGAEATICAWHPFRDPCFVEARI